MHMFKLPWITKEIMLTSLTLISCHSIIQSEETSIAQKASKYKLLKFGKIKYKPGYSAFKVYQLNDNPKTGYIALNGVKVAIITLQVRHHIIRLLSLVWLNQHMCSTWMKVSW